MDAVIAVLSFFFPAILYLVTTPFRVDAGDCLCAVLSVMIGLFLAVGLANGLLPKGWDKWVGAGVWTIMGIYAWRTAKIERARYRSHISKKKRIGARCWPAASERKVMRIGFVAALLFAAGLVGCTGSPGPLEGTWKAEGILPMTITFRPGETEAMGVIEPVGYETKGNAVKVTYKDGMMKGSSIQFTIVDQNTATNPLYTLRRVR